MSAGKSSACSWRRRIAADSTSPVRRRTGHGATSALVPDDRARHSTRITCDMSLSRSSGRLGSGPSQRSDRSPTVEVAPSSTVSTATPRRRAASRIRWAMRSRPCPAASWKWVVTRSRSTRYRSNTSITADSWSRSGWETIMASSRATPASWRAGTMAVRARLRLLFEPASKSTAWGPERSRKHEPLPTSSMVRSNADAGRGKAAARSGPTHARQRRRRHQRAARRVDVTHQAADRPVARTVQAKPGLGASMEAPGTSRTAKASQARISAHRTQGQASSVAIVGARSAVNAVA